MNFKVNENIDSKEIILIEKFFFKGKLLCSFEFLMDQNSKSRGEWIIEYKMPQIDRDTSNIF